MLSQTRRLRLFFQKGKNSLNLFCQNTHMPILSQGTDTINEKLAIFTYVYFLLLRFKKAKKNENS